MNNRPRIIAHRGAGRALKPENILDAFETGIEIGADVIDMDLGMTLDEVVVVYHDLELNPLITRDASEQWVSKGKFVNRMTLAELQTYDVGRIQPGTLYAACFPEQKPVVGARIPTFDKACEFVNRLDPNISYQVEMKSNPYHPEYSFSSKVFACGVADVLRHWGIVERTVVQAFNYADALAMQAELPEVTVSYLTSAETQDKAWTAGYEAKDFGSTAKMIRALGKIGRESLESVNTTWGPQDIEVTRENVAEAHAEGLKVEVWSDPLSGEVVDIQELADMNVDGIITDWPDQAIARLRK